MDWGQAARIAVAAIGVVGTAFGALKAMTDLPGGPRLRLRVKDLQEILAALEVNDPRRPELRDIVDRLLVRVIAREQGLRKARTRQLLWGGLGIMFLSEAVVVGLVLFHVRAAVRVGVGYPLSAVGLGLFLWGAGRYVLDARRADARAGGKTVGG